VNGQVVLGQLLSGILLLAFALAIKDRKPISRAPLWCLAALPMIITPLGLTMFVLIATYTFFLRRQPALA
jgi:hypothetical protein